MDTVDTVNVWIVCTMSTVWIVSTMGLGSLVLGLWSRVLPRQGTGRASQATLSARKQLPSVAGGSFGAVVVVLVESFAWLGSATSPRVLCLGSAGSLAVPCLGSVCLVLASDGQFCEDLPRKMVGWEFIRQSTGSTGSSGSRGNGVRRRSSGPHFLMRRGSG